LAQPPAAKKEILAGGNLWHCAGSTCTLVSEPIQPYSIRACQELQRQAGELSAYGTKDKPFDADRLAKCNSKR